MLNVVRLRICRRLKIWHQSYKIRSFIRIRLLRQMAICFRQIKLESIYVR